MTTINNKKWLNKKPMYIAPSSTPSSTPSTFQTLKETMVSGLGAGVGMSVADRLVTTVLGPRKVEVQTENKIVRSPECEEITRIYKQTISPSLREEYEKCNQVLENDISSHS